MTPEERDLLVAAVSSAHRDRAPHGEIQPHRAFFDLDEAARELAFDDTMRLRKLEAAASADGLTSTARAVLARLRRT